MGSLSSDLHPETGARYLLERRSVEDDDQVAVYQASVFTPSQRMDISARMHMDGSVELEGDAAAILGERYAKRMLAHARQVARSAANRSGDGLPPWPQRILRWRAD